MKRKPFFKFDPFTSIGLVILNFVISQLIAGLLIGLYLSTRNFTDFQSQEWLQGNTGQFVFVLLVEAIVIAAVFWFAKLAKITLARIGMVMPRWKDLGWGVVGYGLYFLCFIVVITVVSQFVPAVDLDQEQVIGFKNAHNNAELLMAFASLVILPPLAEEILFRGFLFSSLRAKLRLRYAVIITSVLFAIGHLQFGSGAPLLWAAAIDTFVLSVFLCMLRERLGSVWPAVFLHAVKNSVAFMILFGARLFI